MVIKCDYAELSICMDNDIMKTTARCYILRFATFFPGVYITKDGVDSEMKTAIPLKCHL